MEGKGTGDKYRWTYEVSRVLQDKRKGTSVSGVTEHDSRLVCFLALCDVRMYDLFSSVP